MTNAPIPADDPEAQAVLWLVRSRDPAFADWEAFEQWLGARPANADAYHAAAAAEAEMVDLLATSTPEAIVAAPARPQWWPAPWLGGALAASLLLAIGYGALRTGAPPTIYETGPGGHREIALADGTRIALNGDTRLAVAADDPRAIRLERGEALFTVRHDPAHPFAVTVAGATIADVGTIFDVVRDAGATRVAVAEGTVIWNPTHEAVRLDAGRRLRAQDTGATLELASVDADAVGGWARGQLAYDGAPLAMVAADVSRALGVAVEVAPAAAARPVRGVVRLDGGPDVVMPRLAALLGVRVRHDKGIWRLSSAP